MKDMTKASNPFYLAFFLLVVCGVSTLVMAVTAVKTDEPIRISQAKVHQRNPIAVALYFNLKSLAISTQI